MSTDPREERDRWFGRVNELLAQINACRNVLRIYPAEHPSVAAALGRLHAVATDLGAGERTVELGFSRGRVFVQGKEAAIANPLSRRVAMLLHSQGIARLRFAPGASVEELGRFVGVLSALPDEGGRPQETAQSFAEVSLPNVEVGVIDIEMLGFSSEGESSEGAEAVWDRMVFGLLNASGDRAETRLEMGVDTHALALLWQRGAEISVSMIETLLAASETCPRDRVSIAGFAERLVAFLGELPHEGRSKALARLLREGVRFVELTDRLAAAVPADHLLASLRTLDLGSDAVPRAVVRRLKYLSLPSSPAAMFAEGSADARPPSDTEVAEARRLLAVLAARKDLDVDAESSEAPAAGAGARLALPPIDPDAIERYQAEIGEEMQQRELAWAIFNLIEAGSREEVETLADRLADLHGYLIDIGQFDVGLQIYEHAVDYQQRWPDSKPLARLSAALRHPDTMSKLAVALKVWGHEHSEPLLRLVAAGGRDAMPALIDMLAIEEDFAVRRRIIDAILRIGPAATPAVLGALGDGRWYVTRNMLLLLRELDERGSAPAVRRMWAHEHPKVKIEVIRTLLRFGDSQATALLEGAMMAKNPDLAHAAISLAGSIGDEQAVQRLAALLEQWSSRLHPGTVAAVIDALARTRNVRAVDVLESFAWANGMRGLLLRRSAREAAVRALGTMPLAAAHEALERLCAAPQAELAQLARELLEASAAGRA